MGCPESGVEVVVYAEGWGCGVVGVGKGWVKEGSSRQRRRKRGFAHVAPTLRADMNQIDRIQRLTTRLVRSLRHVPNNRQLNLFSQEHRRLWAVLILAFKINKSKVGLKPA